MARPGESRNSGARFRLLAYRSRSPSLTSPRFLFFWSRACVHLTLLGKKHGNNRGRRNPSSMPAGAGEGDGGRSYHGSGARKSASEEFIVGELEEGLRVPLLSGREKEELDYDDEGDDNGSDAEPCAFLDLFVLADMVRGVRKILACVALVRMFLRNFR